MNSHYGQLGHGEGWQRRASAEEDRVFREGEGGGAGCGGLLLFLPHWRGNNRVYSVGCGYYGPMGHNDEVKKNSL